MGLATRRIGTGTIVTWSTGTTDYAVTEFLPGVIYRRHEVHLSILDNIFDAYTKLSIKLLQGAFVHFFMQSYELHS